MRSRERQSKSPLLERLLCEDLLEEQDDVPQGISAIARGSFLAVLRRAVSAARAGLPRAISRLTSGSS
jgi:hypothetical protein